MRIKHLALLDAIATSGSLHGAAKVMHLTQPALTSMLHEIESIFGTPLFVRTKKGLAANTVGTTLIGRARLILNELTRADNEVVQILNGKIEFTMGVTPMMMLEIVPRALHSINLIMPNLKLVFVERNVPILLEELAQGKIDMVLASFPFDSSYGHETDAFEYIRLFEEKLCVLVRHGHPLIAKKRVTWSDIAKAQWVLPVQSTLTWRNFSRAFIQRSMTPPEAKYVSSSFHSNIRLIAHTDCLMVAPLSVGKHYSGIGLVEVLDLPFPKAPNPVSIILKKNRVQNEPEKKIISIFLKQLGVNDRMETTGHASQNCNSTVTNQGIDRFAIVTERYLPQTLSRSTTMNKDIAAGKWEQVKGSLKQTWGELTDDDIAQVNGSAQKMAGILQEKYGKTKEEAEKQVNDFWNKNQ